MGDEQLVEELAAVMHAANDGPDCDCHQAAREEFTVSAKVALEWLAERGRLTPDGAMVDIVLPDDTHRYLSTHCRHGRHDACEATELAPGMPRRPSQCKTCGAPCLCPKHQDPDARCIGAAPVTEPAPE